MAKITITVEGSTIGKIVVESDLDQSNSDAFMSYLAASYGTKINEEGEEVARTPKEMVTACWEAIIAGTLANVTRHAQHEAAKAAVDAVPDAVATTAAV